MWFEIEKTCQLAENIAVYYCNIWVTTMQHQMPISTNQKDRSYDLFFVTTIDL